MASNPGQSFGAIAAYNGSFSASLTQAAVWLNVWWDIILGVSVRVFILIYLLLHTDCALLSNLPLYTFRTVPFLLSLHFSS